MTLQKAREKGRTKRAKTKVEVRRQGGEVGHLQGRKTALHADYGIEGNANLELNAISIMQSPVPSFQREHATKEKIAQIRTRIVEILFEDPMLIF